MSIHSAPHGATRASRAGRPNSGGTRTATVKDLYIETGMTATTQRRHRNAGHLPPLVEIVPGRRVYVRAELDAALVANMERSRARRAAPVETHDE